MLSIDTTFDNLNFPIEDIDAVGHTPDDDHPSEYGMKVYTHIVANAINRKGWLIPNGSEAERLAAKKSYRVPSL